MPAGYAIDSTEVTRSQYEAWLKTAPSTADQPPYCAWNTDYAPRKECMEYPEVCQGAGCGKHPQVCVDWCDAYAYCAAIGRRLCGRIGGGSNGFPDWASATASQWYAACSAQGTKPYPYGDGYQPQTCNGGDNATTGCGAGSCLTVEVGSLGGCQSSVSGYEGVYDLSGNVWEWEDSCVDYNGQYEDCRVRGGSFGSYGDDSFLCARDSALGRWVSTQYNGWRCCSAP